MSAVTFGGLASGLDTGTLIDKLVAAERSSATSLQQRQSDLNAQKTIVGNLSTALAALGNLARGMDLASEVHPHAATVSDTRVRAAASATAAPGVYDVRVRQLAQAQVTSSRTFASADAGVLGDGGVTITVGGVAKAVTWTSADSLADVASKINAADAGVTASVLFDGASYRLVTTASATGTAAAPAFVETGDALDLTDVRVAAQDAIVTVSGIDVTRSTNVIADALPGVTLTLDTVTGATDPSTRITVAQDTAALTTKVKDFVAAYNAVNTALHAQLDYTGTKKGSNTLFGDSMLRQLSQQLGALASDAYGSSNLGALGITRDKAGAMTLDASKLEAALAADPDALEGLFVTNQFATKLATLTDQYTRAGDGFFATKTQALTDRHKALQAQIDRINTAADALQTRLERQFSALEQAMSELQRQSASLTAILR